MQVTKRRGQRRPVINWADWLLTTEVYGRIEDGVGTVERCRCSGAADRGDAD